MKIILGVVAVAIIAFALYCIVLLIVRLTSQKRGVSRSETRKLLRQNNEMKALLARIAHGTAGSPELEADLLLEKFQNEDLKELE